MRISRFVVSTLVGLLGFQSAEAIFPAVALGQTASQSVQFQLNKSAFLKILPVETAFTYNSRRPYSFNDRSFWAGKGWSSSLSLGFAFESRFLSVQIAPELYFTQNKDFNSPLGVNYLQRSDLPYRLESDSFGRAYLGESYAHLHIGWFRVGASSQTFTWGAGERNNMMMGTHAPGVKRIFAGTRRPIAFPFEIGGLNYEVFYAWPENSSRFSNTRTRFMSGVDFNFEPGFVSGLRVGLTRVFQSYIYDGRLTSNQWYDPFETFLKRSLPALERADRDGVEGDQMASVYITYSNERLGAKMYGEYAREDHNWDVRDAYTNPHNSRGYLFGVKKWFNGTELNHKNSIHFEFVNTSGANLSQVRYVTGMYVGGIREGHTNGGQPLGAGIGPNSTSAFIGYSQYLDWGRLGLSIEKVELAEHDYFESRDRYRPIESDAHRVNLHYGLDASFNFRGFILEPRVMGIQYYNEVWDPDRDFWNWHIRLGVTYPFEKREKNREN